ncbi:methyltransferase domain-containing protein [Granulicella sp. 5B5]|uniref:methyltransferase domain-containing protein n=1 Tax=Granulicella sp. 5B5 TaxID=1617967 RepID=UPI0015F563C6|nr:methyltransferase domain-containing protein [Granulicella sp. 5B5]QMV18857.1 methyltransferase domain-containing protein [Granulicella sp. 5B5]
MPSKPIDFSRRVAPVDLPEWLDDPCTYEQLRSYLGDLEQVNTLSFGARPTVQWLGQLLERHGGQALRIVDVGCGGGDMLRRIERWAKRRGLAVELVGIDLNPEVVRAAREMTPSGSRIEWISGDVYSYTEGADGVISALLTHHLEEIEIVRFLTWMEATARCGWYINDLCREATPYKLFSMVAILARWHKAVRHDGPVSFRRSFREDDWHRMLASAGVAVEHVEARRWTPGRLCVGRTKSA